MSKGREARREQVAELLKEGLGAKLQRANWEGALQKLEKAHALATKSPRVVDPWPALTAYRLGHVRMRKGDLTLKELQAIDKLFEAARNPCLGALPFVYQVAALRRMKDQSRANTSELDARIDEVLKAAFEALNQYDAYHRNVEYSLNVDEEEDEDDENVSRRYAPVTESMLQYNAFNLLELAAYFVGYDSRQWDGRGNLPQTDHLEVGTTQAPWRVVGSDILDVRCSEAIAREELMARSKDHPDALVLWLPEGGKRAKCIRNGDPKPITYRLAALLLYPYAKDERYPSKDHMVNQIFEGSEDNYRKIPSRHKKELAEILGRPEDEIFVNTEEYKKLHPDIVVFGAVQIGSLLLSPSS